MARWAALFGLVVALAGAVHWWGTYLTTDRNVATASPSPGPNGPATPIALRPGASACVAPTVIDPGTRRAQVPIAPNADPLSLALEASAPGYRSQRTVTVPASAAAHAIDLPLDGPPRSVTGRVCIRNAGATKAVLLGTNNPVWIGPPRTSIDGRELPSEAITLNLLEGPRRSLLDRLGTITTRASDFTDGLMPAWLAWIVVVALVVGTPFAVFAGFWATLRDEE